MIVDLIRHDLHGVVGDDVSVKQFCRVEEYETLWQMVSVIEGARPLSDLDVDSGTLGWEVLKRTLPAGGFISRFIVYSTCNDCSQGV
jgi:para-aminobenzoate synthetase